MGAGIGYGAGRLISASGEIGAGGTAEIEDAASGLAPGERTPPMELTSGAVLRRVYGGQSRVFGNYWTTIEPTPDNIGGLGLPPVNTMEGVVSAYFPSGTSVILGKTQGGAIEVIIRNTLLKASFPGLWDF